MHINIGHDSAAVGIVLQIVEDAVHLVHHAFLVLVLHAQLIAVGFSNGTVLVCPAVPDVAVKIMDIVGFLLPDPQDLVHGTFQRSFSKGQRREFLSQIITVHHTETLDGISGSTVLPYRAHLFPFRTGSVLNYILAHIDKYIIC